MKAVKLVSFVACGAVGLISSAETLTWTGAGGMTWDASTQSWQTPAGSASAWVGGRDALFNGSGTGTVTLASGLTVRTLTFDGASASYEFAGKELLVSDKTIVITNGATFTLGNVINRNSGDQYKDIALSVGKGSTLRLLKNGLVDTVYPIFNINGGKFVVSHQGIYVQNLNLSNGALVTDPTGGDGTSATFRMGANVERFYIRSNGPAGATNEVQTNITVWDKHLPNRPGTDYRLVLDVGDQPLLVTGRFFGPIAESKNDYSPHRIDKVGSGTLIMRCNQLGGPDGGGATTFGETNDSLKPSVLTAAVHVVEGKMRVERAYVFRNENGRCQDVVVESGAEVDFVEGYQVCRLTVLPGGVARMIGTKVLRTSKVTLDGGILWCDHQNNFLCDVTLRNGGVLEDGSSIRFGMGGETYKYPTIRSEGAGTNEVKAMLRLYRYDGGTDVESQAIVFDADAPLRLSRYPHTHDDGAGWFPRHFWKTGSSELILNYAVTDSAYVPGVITVKEGTLRIAMSNAMKSNMDLDLAFQDKTALAVNAGTENSVKKATFAGEVTLDVGEGAKLTFVDYDLSGMTRLNVPSTLGEQGLRFGTTKCLTDAELAKFRCRGYAFEQDDDGYVHPRKKGLVLLFR